MLRYIDITKFISLHHHVMSSLYRIITLTVIWCSLMCCIIEWKCVTMMWMAVAVHVALSRQLWMGAGI